MERSGVNPCYYILHPFYQDLRQDLRHSSRYRHREVTDSSDPPEYDDFVPRKLSLMTIILYELATNSVPSRKNMVLSLDNFQNIKIILFPISCY